MQVDLQLKLHFKNKGKCEHNISVSAYSKDVLTTLVEVAYCCISTKLLVSSGSILSEKQDTF